jgi:hypothetical protein
MTRRTRGGRRRAAPVEPLPRPLEPAQPTGQPTSQPTGQPTPPTEPIDETAALAERLPLAQTWQIFLHYRSTAGLYNNSIERFGEPFGTIAGFWRVFNALPPPSAAFSPPRQMGVGREQIKAYSIFVAGIEPTWEDATNAAGGEVFCRCHLEPDAFDALWETTVLACVGGALADAQVVGVRAVDNSFKTAGETQSKVEVWHRDVATGDAVRRRIQEELAPHPTPPLDLQGHEEKSARTKSFVSGLKRQPRARR